MERPELSAEKLKLKKESEGNFATEKYSIWNKSVQMELIAEWDDRKKKSVNLNI